MIRSYLIASLTSLVVMLLACVAPLHAAEYTLTWDPNPEPEVAGYKVHWGEKSRTYTHHLDVGVTTSHTFSSLRDDRVYYFSVTAYDSSGFESDYSVEVAAASRHFLFGIDKSVDDGGWVEVITPDYDHLHWLKVDWPDYNALGGESRVVTGDIDGDGFQEVIIGLGPIEQEGGIPLGRFQILDHDYTHLAWGQVDWSDYNMFNGETWPACGDLDGDGVDEIFIGLGAGGQGNVGIYNYAAGGLVLRDWTQVDWADYANLIGEVRVAAGDLDGDRKDEVILGLGNASSFSAVQGGRFQVLDDDLTHLAWGEVDWPQYNSLNGETRPATGDLDGDGNSEILIGLGRGGEGMVQVAQYNDGAVSLLNWLNVGWTDYATFYGETRPTTDDLDMDGKDEVLVGLGKGGLGRNLIFDDLSTLFEHQVTLEIWPKDYAQSEGGSWPAIQRRLESDDGKRTAPNQGSGFGLPWLYRLLLKR